MPLLTIEIYKDLRDSEHGIMRVVFCAILAILFKYNFGINFWGLEYEDAYVFSFCARQFSYGIYPPSFLIDAVSLGSLAEPMALGTYGGHFIMYSTFLSIFTQLFGWSPCIISVVNALVAFFILLILAAMGKNSKTWMIAPLIYCAAPIINVFATCFLSEIFSSFICLSFVYTIFREKSKENSLLSWLTFFVAILCKRENLLLLAVPFIDEICSNGKFVFPNIKQTFLRYVPYLCITMVYFLIIQNVFDIEKYEAGDIGRSTFSIHYFVRLFPSFIKSLVSLKYFGVSIIVGLTVIVLRFIKFKNERKEVVVCLTLATLYLILYSSHYRGYFFIQGEKPTAFDTFRYINNFFYLIPAASIFRVNPPHKKIIIVICSIIAGLTLCLTITERLHYSRIENEGRFSEAEEVVEYIENAGDDKPMLISDNILVYQNICKDNFSVCDTRFVQCMDLDDGSHTYFCVSPDLDYLKERYNVSIPLDRFKAVKTLANGRILYIYQNDCCPPN